MARTVKKHKFWLIPLCLLVAGIASVLSWQQLQAQGVPPGTPGYGARPAPYGPGAPMPIPPSESALEAGYPGAPGMPGVPGMGAMPGAPGMAPVTATVPSEPTYAISSVLPGSVQTQNIKNWDGVLTPLLRFKYKTTSGKTITVHLPATYKTETRTKAGWETLFHVFAMDREAQLDAMEANRGADISAYAGMLADQIRGQTPSSSLLTSLVQMSSGMATSGVSGSPAAPAMDYARSSLPSMGMQLPPMPTPLPSAMINP